jgi:nucleoside-diphosphate-sugar epimerase
MNVFLTGATGFVGSSILKKCMAEGHSVYALVRPGSEHKLPGDSLHNENFNLVKGNLHDPFSYQDSLKQCEAVIHLVGIIREIPSKDLTFQRIHIDGTKNLVEAAVNAGVQRFVHMSALGARPTATSEYHATKWAAEELVRAGGLDYVIFRPSVIFGPDDEFVNMLCGLVKLPICPVIGDGKYRLQPVSIHTVSSLFEQALSTAHTHSEYEVGGPEAMTYNELLNVIGRALGKKKVIKFHQPLWLMKPVVHTLDRFPFFPITRNQLTMLLEENICTNGERIYFDFNVQPIPFEKGIAEYL